jgi:hypothetical protein
MLRNFAVGWVAAGVALAAVQVHAVSLGFDPAAQTTTVGSSVGVQLRVSDLVAGGAPSLGEFDLDILFDPAVVSFASVTFGDPGLGDQLDPSGLGSLIGADGSVPGQVNLFEVSLDLPSDLDTLQPASFVLATLTFDAIGAGVSPLTLAINAFGDALGDPLAIAALETGEITVNAAAAIPEPATGLLVGVGWAVMAVCSRRRLVARLASAEE